jgi:formate hydrogenlyase transcriptional activator
MPRPPEAGTQLDVPRTAEALASSLPTGTDAERYRTLLEINNAVISSLTRESLFRAIAQALHRVVPFARTALFLHDPEKDVLRLFVVETSLPSAYFFAGLEMPAGDSHVGWAFRNERPLLRRDLEHERQYPMEERAYGDGVRSYMIVPLQARGRCIGTLAVASTRPHQYTETHVAFLQEAAKQVALAVENMQAYEAMEQEVARRREAEAALREMHEFSHEIISGASQGIIVYDAALRYVVFNRFMEELTGKRAEEVLGKHAPDAFPFLRELGMEAMLRRALQGEVVTTPDILIRMPTGREVWESNRYSPHRDAQGNVIGVIALVNDITKRKQAEEALKAALSEVQEFKNRLQAENVYLQEEIRREHNFVEMVGSSAVLLATLRKVEQVAAADSTVLISGETGTGKELIARAIHSRSARKDRPVVKVNCSAISAGLVESELFGHVKGAFTGALERRIGRFELADRGTLFLDEVGELPLETQVKLLRVLQEGEFEPVGSNRTIRTDVRVIAATNRDLQEAVQAGRFRPDLYYRLNVFPLDVPPLRERRSDIPQLVMFFLSHFAAKFGKTLDTVPQDTMERLASYAWPGNVRELRNVIERAVVLSEGPILRLSHDLVPMAVAGGQERTDGNHPAALGAPGAGADSAAPVRALTPPRLSTLQDAERDHILAALRESRGVVEGPNGAAQILDLHPNTLRSRMKRLGIKRASHEMS